MKYRNKNTGFVLETECVVKGENWEELSSPTFSRSKKTEKQEIVTEEQEVAPVQQKKRGRKKSE